MEPTNDNLIAEATAIILWNDVPTGVPSDDIAVFASFDPRAGDRSFAMRFDNSAGAFMADWRKHPKANAKAVFDDFMQSEYICALTEEFWRDVCQIWLAEIGKITECGWARSMLRAIQAGGQYEPIRAARVPM
ncbi:hypothetical protein [Mesorhizobium marinum]|uniref:Uncharacterized protein n=1 Tax=Mesorhizobium marinum TaxID=3228790 RepID=A0ABV3R5H5_9HYPH